MDTEIRWVAGDPVVCRELEPRIRDFLDDRGVTWVRRHSDRRRLAHVALPDGSRCFLKHYLRGERHPVREWWKRRLRLTTGEREWRTLVRLRAAGVSVPEPLARAELPAGEQIVVTDFVDGVPLESALATRRSERGELLRALGCVVRRLHAVGWVHRDLHRENIRVTPDGPVLLDFQAALPLRLASAQRDDLGELDYSLNRVLSIGDRVRLRAATLGIAAPYDASDRAALRAIGRASVERWLSHARSRTRRCERPGRRAGRFEARGGRGLLRRGEDPESIRELLADDVPAAKAFEVRRYHRSGARRAWVAAHGLEARDLAAPAPVAFLEWRRLGVPLRSVLVLESSPRTAPDPEAELEALTRLWIELHEARVDVPGLATADVGFFETAAGLRGRIDALDRVRFARRLSDGQRIEDLARLEAGLEGPCDGDRRRALGRYRARLPFPMPCDAVVAAIQSRASAAKDLSRSR